MSTDDVPDTLTLRPETYLYAISVLGYGQNEETGELLLGHRAIMVTAPTDALARASATEHLDRLLPGYDNYSMALERSKLQ